MVAPVAQKPFSAVLFDMDNTLFDLMGAKIWACGGVTGRLGVGSAGGLFSYFLRRQGGFDDPENIRDYMRDHSCYEPDLYRQCVDCYLAELLRHIVPYPGVKETLGLLASSGIRMGIVTDARRPDALLRLETAGLSEFFALVVTQEMTGAHKPSTLPFLKGLAGIGATARETVLVGDSPRRDIAPGVILGMRTVYARYGDRFSQRGEEGGADHAIDLFSELLPIVGIPGSDRRITQQVRLF